MPVAYGQVRSRGEQACPAGTSPIVDGQEPESGCTVTHDGGTESCHPVDAHVASVSHPICTASPYSHVTPTDEHAALCIGAEEGHAEPPSSIVDTSVIVETSIPLELSAMTDPSGAASSALAPSPSLLLASGIVVPVSPAERTSLAASTPPGALEPPHARSPTAATIGGASKEVRNFMMHDLSSPRAPHKDW
jgi:hypothetical protein